MAMKWEEEPLDLVSTAWSFDNIHMSSTYGEVYFWGLLNVYGTEVIITTSRARYILDGAERSLLAKALNGFDVVETSLLRQRTPIQLINLVFSRHHLKLIW